MFSFDLYYRENDDLRTGRKELLDGWLREIVSNGKIMLNKKAHDKIYDFLEIKKHFG